MPVLLYLLKEIVMAKKKLDRLYLMVIDPDNIMKDYVWCTVDELPMYREQGYQRINKK